MLRKDALILVVDDMKLVRKSVIKYLASLGYFNFIEATNGNEAVTQVRNHSVEFIFMDVVMPLLTGNEALKQIRIVNPLVPVVMLSSVADEGVIEECKNIGITGYVLKPLNHADGPKKLESMLARVKPSVSTTPVEF